MRKLKVLIADDVEIIAKTNQQIVEKNEEIEVVGLAYDGGGRLYYKKSYKKNTQN